MKYFYKTALAAASLFVCQSTLALSALPDGMFETNAEVKLLSNYVWRGLSHSDNGPSVQGGLTAIHSETNLYGNLQLANIDRLDARGENSSIELLTGLGLKGPLLDAEYDVQGLYYSYPDAHGLGWGEFLSSVQYEWIKGGLSFSTNALNSGSTGWYTYLSARWLIPQNTYFVAPPDLYLLGKLGRYTFNRGNYADSDYTDYLIGVEKTFDQRFSVSGMITGTDRNFHGGGIDETHLVLKLAASF